MARFVAEHPDPFGWNPLQYFGLPTQMWYLPGIPYTAALAIKLLPFLKPEHVYRLVVTTLACLVPVTTFLFATYFTRSRRYALLATLAITFFSPSYFFFDAVDGDRGIAQVPWRIQVLLKYGEGPHNAGLALLPLALIAAWRAATRRRYPDVFCAALLFAAVVLTNWVAGMALAWCCLMMLLAGIGTAHETGFLSRRLVAAAVLAYLMACFWLTPDYIHTVAFNWPKDAFGYKLEPGKIWLLTALAAGPLLIRFGFWKAPRHFYFCFLLLCSFGFVLIVCSHYWYGLGPIPESRRYALEAEIFVFLLLTELLRYAMQTSRLTRTLAVAVAAWMLFEGRTQLAAYPFKAWVHLRPAPRESFIEYKVARALSELHPRGRVLAAGGTRFRLNSWFLLPQVGGTFESGLVNRTSLDLIYSLKTGIGVPPETRAADALRQLRIAGVEYAAFHGSGSREHWHDYAGHPVAWDQLLEPVWQQEDDAIYRVPFRGYAHLVHRHEVLPYVPVGAGLLYTDAYVKALEDRSRPRLTDRWHGPSRMIIEGSIPKDMAVSVQVSHHPGWRAEQDGKPIPLEADPVGFLLLHPESASASRIELRFGGAAQQKWFAVGSAVSWMSALALLYRSKRRRPPILDA